MIAHDEVHVTRNAHRTIVAQIFVLRRHVWFRERLAIHINGATANLHDLVGQRNDALDERFAAIEWIPEDNYVAALNRLKPINKLVDEDALLVGKERRHAGAFHFNWLIEEHDDDQRKANGDEQITRPH